MSLLIKLSDKGTKIWFYDFIIAFGKSALSTSPKISKYRTCNQALRSTWVASAADLAVGVVRSIMLSVAGATSLAAWRQNITFIIIYILHANDHRLPAPPKFRNIASAGST